MMLTEIFIIILLFVMSAGTESFLRRKFEIPRRKTYMYKPIKKPLWGIGLGIHTFFWIVFFFVIPRDVLFVVWLLSYFTVLFSFQLWMQFKFELELKQYIITINSIVWLSIILVSIRIMTT